MSTRRIRELAEYVKSHFAAGELLADEALKEAENIERAAKAFVTPIDTKTIITSREFVRLMQSIAKDTP